MTDSEAPEEKRSMTWAQRAVYSLPQIAISVSGALIGTWLTYFYLPPEGDTRPELVSATLFAALMFGGRIVDAVADPLIGYWSDRTNTSWGRRLPFIIFGTPLLALSFGLLFFPPTAEASLANNVFLAVMLFFYWVTFTVVVAPYFALVPEIAATNKGRMTLSTVMAVFMMIGTIGASGIGVLDSEFPDGITVIGIHFKSGIQFSVAITAVATVFLFWALLINIRETPRDASKEVPAGLWSGVKSAFANPAFRTYLGIACFLQMGLVMLGTGLPYVCSQLLEPHPEVHLELQDASGTTVLTLEGQMVTAEQATFSLDELPDSVVGALGWTTFEEAESERVEIAWEPAMVEAIRGDDESELLIAPADDAFELRVTGFEVPVRRLVAPGQGSTWVGILMGLLVILALVWMPFVNKLVDRMGKKKLMLICGTCFGLALSGLSLLILFPDPAVPMIVAIVLLSFPASAAFILPIPIYADVVDLDEKETGVRREGIYTGASAIFAKTALGLAGALTVLILKLGDSHNDPLGLILLGPASAAFVFLGTWIFSKHPVDH